MLARIGELSLRVILDHNKAPRNSREVPDANRMADGHNSLWGDQFRLWVKVADGVIEDVEFQG